MVREQLTLIYIEEEKYIGTLVDHRINVEWEMAFAESNEIFDCIIRKMVSRMSRVILCTP